MSGSCEIANRACRQTNTVMQIGIKWHDNDCIASNGERCFCAVKFARQGEDKIVSARTFGLQFESMLTLTHRPGHVSLPCQTDSQLKMTIAIRRIQLKAMLGLRDGFV